ncbi:MAG: single-stranded-DNA-specific exonuclease RecJ [Patescibacteria group bacterium]
MKSTWVVAPRVDDDVVTQFLYNRGIADDARAEFLSPNWETGTHAPSLFTAMPRAVARVFDALDRGEKIVIHGDYDADGVCGSSLLFEALREIVERLLPPSLVISHDLSPSPITVFLPDREKDGYGVAMHTIERIAAEGAKLLITVDCGIANADQLDRAHELGVDVVVCDHHQLGDRLPAHAALLHPLAPGEVYPNKTLCGTGVAFKFASALFDEARRRGADFPVGHEKWYLDLVAIATVTDVMPLTGENRVLEHFGLRVLRKTRRHGLRAILSAAGADAENVDTETIGFRIGPRLNAAGRLASADFAFKTVTARFPAEAAEAAATLEALNTERQKVFAKAYVEAKEILVKSEKEKVESSLVAVWKHDWAPGIVGLIAGRLVSDFGVPAFAFARVGDHWVGSGRSVGGLHLVEAMASCGDIFLRRGGHPQACGLSIASEELLGTFRDRMSAFSLAHFGGVQPVPTVAVDMELPLEGSSFALVDALKACAPFGEGNRAPVFVARNVEVIAADTMGKTGSHLRMNVYDSNRAQRKVIGFGFGDMASTLNMGDTVDVVYALEVNEWKGKKELQFRIVDICSSAE